MSINGDLKPFQILNSDTSFSYQSVHGLEIVSVRDLQGVNKDCSCFNKYLHGT